MTDLGFKLSNPTARNRAVEAVRNAPDGYVVHIGEPTRSLGQNSRYWVDLTNYLRQINAVVNQVASDTGHEPLDVKREAASGLPIEYGIILFAKKPEVAHEILKDICNVPTSTKLGTKKFIEFEDRMLAVMGDILGHVRAMV